MKEWCLDYSDGATKLWLVTDLAWYCIATTRLPSPDPHPIYAACFASARAKFSHCAAVSTSLLRYPQNDYDAVLQHVLQQMPNMGGEEALLANADFIANQMANLAPPTLSPYAIRYDRYPAPPHPLLPAHIQHPHPSLLPP